MASALASILATGSRVRISNLPFNPANLVVAARSTVTWLNQKFQWFFVRRKFKTGDLTVLFGDAGFIFIRRGYRASISFSLMSGA
jgi:hypothetical protein